MTSSTQNSPRLIAPNGDAPEFETRGIVHDIEATLDRYQSDREALRRLVKFNSLLNEFVEQCPSAMCVYDDDGTLMAANLAYKRVHPQLGSLIEQRGIASLRFEDVVRAQLSERFSGEPLDDAVAEALMTFDSKEVMVAERDYGKNGYYRFTQYPLNGGAVARFAVEISEERRREQELLAASAAAEEASRLAEESLAHERERKREARLLSELGEWLQSCKSLEELYAVIAQFMEQFFPGGSGELYIYSNSRDVLFGACQWPQGVVVSEHIHADDCWSLRRGRMYKYGSGLVNFRCPHTTKSEDDTEGYKHSVCIPLVAHGDTVGMLHIRFLDAVAEAACSQDPYDYAFAVQCSEQISLAIANVRLRDELREQSTKDPLTGLYNRRYFTEQCRREINIARSASTCASMMAVDADHFKMFNDNHGHDAGDTVLRALSATMSRVFDGDEIVARIGGEEFAILLPDTSPDIAKERAEALRCAVEAMSIRYGEKTLPRVTVSIGLANFPADGECPQELLGVADTALYTAKASGRNCIVASGEVADE